MKNKSSSTALPENWPDNFDFETDPVCQKTFKPYIENFLKDLEVYDNQRDHLSAYKFHIHAQDAANDVRQSCLTLGLSDKVANNMYWATLIHDLGKIELPVEIWDLPTSPTPKQRALKRTHIDLGVQKFEKDFEHIDHPFKNLALDIINHHHEAIDGSGHHGLTGEQLSAPARLVAIIEHYDGQRHPRPHQIKRGDKFDPPSIFKRIEEKYAGHFDPVFYNAFKTLKLSP